MNNRQNNDAEMPAEIDFRNGVRGLHHIPATARVLMPVAIERGVWVYFSAEAERREASTYQISSPKFSRAKSNPNGPERRQTRVLY